MPQMHYLEFLVFFVYLNSKTNCHQRRQKLDFQVFLDLFNILAQWRKIMKSTYQREPQFPHMKVPLKERS